MPNQDKDKIREPLLRKRAQLTKKQQQDLSDQIVNNLVKSEYFLQAKHVALYHAVRGEADPHKLIKDGNSTSKDKKFYLPVLSKSKDIGLQFAQINKQTQYKDNQFAIPEPILDSDNSTDTKTLDIVIMPLLGFDLSGNRLGMGGGYYDRCFAFKNSKVEKPILIGFAYQFQKIDIIKAEPWDIGLDALVTEKQLISFM